MSCILILVHFSNYLLRSFTTHFTSITASCDHLLCTIHNGETIDLADMVYMTNVYHLVTLLLYTLHYPSLIIQWGTPLLLNVFGIARGEGSVRASHFASNHAFIFGRFSPSVTSS